MIINSSKRDALEAEAFIYKYILALYESFDFQGVVFATVYYYC